MFILPRGDLARPRRSLHKTSTSGPACARSAGPARHRDRQARAGPPMGPRTRS